ncbi:MAG TPA: hypothetical protein VLZ74_08860 [Methylocella sp.]|nr:hypothetical protein [Methylocella sp.]
MRQVNVSERLFAFIPKRAGPLHLAQNVGRNRLLIGGGEQRHDAWLAGGRELWPAARIPRHLGKDRACAEHQPFAGNLHTRMQALSPRIPFLQKLLP